MIFYGHQFLNVLNPYAINNPWVWASWNCYGPQSWLVNGMVTMAHFWGVIFQKNIDVNEVKAHEELFVFVRCQVIRSILKDVMFFVHLDISGSYPRHGGWSLFPCPDALEDGEGCIFFRCSCEQGSKDAMKGFNYNPPSLLKICDLLCVAIGGLM